MFAKACEEQHFDGALNGVPHANVTGRSAGRRSRGAVARAPPGILPTFEVDILGQEGALSSM
eukprot:5900172-Pyramimonas_sp.AAC.1